MGKLFEIVRPNSVDNEAYAEYEYLLRWVGRDGADYQYLFYDAEFDERVRTEVINEKSSTRIESLIDSEERTITLTANDLSENDLKVMSSMLMNKYVTRIKLDGTTERYGVESNSFNYRKSDLRYDLSFDIIQYSRALWK